MTPTLPFFFNSGMRFLINVVFPEFDLPTTWMIFMNFHSRNCCLIAPRRVDGPIPRHPRIVFRQISYQRTLHDGVVLCFPLVYLPALSLSHWRKSLFVISPKSVLVRILPVPDQQGTIPVQSLHSGFSELSLQLHQHFS